MRRAVTISAEALLLPGAIVATARAASAATTWTVAGPSANSPTAAQVSLDPPTGNNYRVLGLSEVASGRWALAAVTNIYGRDAASYLTYAAGPGTYNDALVSGITTTPPLGTPWRTAAVVSLSSVTTSTIDDDLAAPSKVAGTSWVKPGHGDVVLADIALECVRPEPATAVHRLRCHNGGGYVLTDEGSSSSWAPGVVNDAKSKGVGVILWCDSSNLKTAQQCGANQKWSRS